MPSPHLSQDLKSLRIHNGTPAHVAHTAFLSLAPGLTADCYQTRFGTAWIVNAPNEQPRFATSHAVNLYFARRKHYQRYDITRTYRSWANDVAQRHRRPSARFLRACRIVHNWLTS